MIKLKLGKPATARTDGSTSQNTAASSPSTAGSAQPPPPKLKLNVTQPPTPTSQPPNAGFPPTDPPAKKKRAYVRKDPDSKKANGKKRAADDDTISPAPKRAASGPARKISLKIPNNHPGEDGRGGLAKIPLIKKRPSVPKFVELRARGKAPPRPKGVGYDSEDSDTEKDPAIQQALILRMEPGEDANYIREAIAEGKIGPHPSQGDAEVSLKFVEKTYRRAVVKVRGRLYGAVLVDLPCVVESMKSFDKKGWWKVADVTQMLLVLGRCASDEEARSLPLPREINKDTFQYAHGLTPPMHWVRKRRFRKRINYTQVQNVEEEVAKLLEQDKLWEQSGGQVTSETLSRMEMERSQEPQDYDDDDDEDAEGEAVATVETDQYEQEMEEDDEPDEDLEANLQAMFDDEEGEASVADLIAESPAPLPDQAVSRAAVESAMPSEAATPISTAAGEAAQTSDDEEDGSEDGSEEDSDDDDADSIDAVDEDAQAKAAEKAQQMEEVADLEREVERARHKVKAMTNQLLRQREMQKLAALEEDLRVKKGVFGLDDGEDSEEG